MIQITRGANRAPTAPLFQIKTARGYVPMTRTYFVDHFKKLAEKAGYNPRKYSGHSFRRGSGTRAFNLGCNRDLIKWQGDWVSDAWESYIELEYSKKLEVPTALAADLAQHEATKWQKRSGSGSGPGSGSRSRPAS